MFATEFFDAKLLSHSNDLDVEINFPLNGYIVTGRFEQKIKLGKCRNFSQA